MAVSDPGSHDRSAIRHHSQILATSGPRVSCSGSTRRQSARSVRVASRRTPPETGPPRGSTRHRAPRGDFRITGLSRPRVAAGSCSGAVRSAPAHTTIAPGSATPARTLPRSRAAMPPPPGPATRRNRFPPTPPLPTPAAAQLMDPDPAHRAPPPHPGHPSHTPGPQPRITPHNAARLRDLDAHGHGADRCAPRSNGRGHCRTTSNPSPRPRPRPRPRHAADLDTPRRGPRSHQDRHPTPLREGPRAHRRRAGRQPEILQEPEHHSPPYWNRTSP